MPWGFSRLSNTAARASVLAVGLFLLLILAVTAAVALSPYETGESLHRNQPIPFSHKHHVGGLRLDCRFCHARVEDFADAGMPSVETCMGCHSQVWKEAPVLEPLRKAAREKRAVLWTRVYDLPDFVYFHHAVHVRKGIGCVSCHGHVAEMPMTLQATPLTMEWCLECHRDPKAHLRSQDRIPLTETTDDGPDPVGSEELARLYNVQSRTDCYVCHR